MSKEVNSIIESILSSNPVLASSLGDYRYLNKLGAYDKKNIDAEKKQLKQFLKQIKPTTKSNKLTKIVLETSLLDFDDSYSNPMTPILTCTNAVMNPIIQLSSLTKKQKVTSIIERTKYIPRYLKEAEDYLKKQHPPEIYVDIASHYCKSLIEFLNNEARRFCNNKLDTKEAEAAIRSYKKSIKKLKTKKSFAIGKNRYQKILKISYGLSYSTDKIYNIGQQTYKQVRNEIIKFGKQHHPNLDWKKPDKAIARLKQIKPTPEKNVLKMYNNLVDKCIRFIIQNKLCPLTKKKVKIIPTPKILRQMLPLAAYSPAQPFDKNSKGIFYVTLPEYNKQLKKRLPQHNHGDAAFVTLHETYPGHHNQLTYATPLNIQKLMLNVLLAEGWAHYCEQLMDEQGFYKDKEAKLAYLFGKLWRAVRVMVDVSMHCKGMSVKKATKIFTDKALLDPQTAQSEALAITYMPTYRICYVLGKNEILKLRKKTNLPLYQFHKKILDQGMVRIDMIKKVIL